MAQFPWNPKLLRSVSPVLLAKCHRHGPRVSETTSQPCVRWFPLFFLLFLPSQNTHQIAHSQQWIIQATATSSNIPMATTLLRSKSNPTINHMCTNNTMLTILNTCIIPTHIKPSFNSNPNSLLFTLLTSTPSLLNPPWYFFSFNPSNSWLCCNYYFHLFLFLFVSLFMKFYQRKIVWVGRDLWPKEIGDSVVCLSGIGCG